MNAGAGLLTKPLMFLSSYAPLLILLAIRFEGTCLRLACLLLALLGVAGLLVLMRVQHKRSGQQARTTIETIRPAGEGASSYLASYLLPFLTVSNPSGCDLVVYGGFFLIAFAITAKTGIIQVNPTLFLLGYDIYSITEDKGSQRYLLSRTKESITAGTTVMTSRMSNDVVLFERIADVPEECGGVAS